MALWSLIEITYFKIIREAVESLNMIFLFSLKWAFIWHFFIGFIILRLYLIILLTMIIIILAISEDSFFWCIQRCRLFNWVILHKFIPKILWFIHLDLWILFNSFKFFPSCLIYNFISNNLIIFWIIPFCLYTLLLVVLERLVLWTIIFVFPIVVFSFLLITLILLLITNIFWIKIFIFKVFWLVWFKRIIVIFLKFSISLFLFFTTYSNILSKFAASRILFRAFNSFSFKFLEFLLYFIKVSLFLHF